MIFTLYILIVYLLSVFITRHLMIKHNLYNKRKADELELIITLTPLINLMVSVFIIYELTLGKFKLGKRFQMWFFSESKFW